MKFTAAVFGAILFTTSQLSAQPGYCRDAGARRAARVTVGSTAVAGNVALFLYFKNAWWSGEKSADGFTFRNDWDQEFRDQDKLGHSFGGYHLARMGRDLLIGGCVSRDRAATLAFLYATAFQLQIELWDATQAKYGFSTGDLLFNTIGATYMLAQHHNPGLASFKPTISYWPTDAMDACRNDASKCGELRGTLDYAGQTYWISTDVDALLPEKMKRAWPGILRFSVGHSITDWIVAEGTTGCPPGSIQCVRRAQRKIVLSLDLDAEKLPGNHPVWRRIKHELSYIRFPAPAIILTPDVRVEGWYR